MPADNQTPDAEFDDSGGGIEITDVYFILFRRKWLILGGILLGALAAAGLWKVRQPLYESDAKLMVKYVLDTPAIVIPGTANSSVHAAASIRAAAATSRACAA